MRQSCLGKVFVLALALVAFVGSGPIAWAAMEIPVTLQGEQEVPPVSTSANGTGTITIGDDKSVTGTVTTTGITGTAAHIHLAAPGQNGGVIIPLTKSGDNTWTVREGAKLTDEQYAALKAGNVYVNVHSAAHPGGEIRAQLKPQS